jgi:hypothetical protein
LPAAQDVQALSRSFPVVAALNLPAPQGMHLLSASLPEVVILYLPAPQFKHLLSRLLPDVVILYLPAPQFKQVAAAAREYFPAPQAVHDASVVAPVELKNLPAPQSVHGADPVSTLYFPRTHTVQLKSGPDEPALQVQVVKAVLPASVHSSGFPERLRSLWEG